MKKKVVSMLLAMTMLMGVLAGCGDQKAGKSTEPDNAGTVSTDAQESETPEVKEPPVTVKMRTRNSADVSDEARVLAYVNELLLEKYNIQLELEYASSTNEIKKMHDLTLAAKEEVDLIWVNSTMYSTYAAEGSIIPLDDLLAEYAPELLETIDQKYFDLTAYDGKKYAVPCQQIMVTYDGYIVQKQYADEYGKLPEHIDNWDEIFPFLDWLVEKHPEVYPTYSQTLFNVYDNQYFERVGGTGNCRIRKDDPTTVYVAVDEYATPTGWMYDWKEKGYVRPEEGTGLDQTADLAANKFAVVNGTLKPGVEEEYLAKYGVEWVTVEVGQPFMNASSVQATMLAVPFTSKHPEAAAKLLNALFTDAEVFNALMFGIEGIHYVKDPDCDTHVKTVQNSGWSLYQGGWAFGNQFLMYTYDDMSKTVWEETKALNDAAMASPLGAFKFDPSNVQTEIAQCNAVKSEFGTRWYNEDSAKKNDEMWAKLKTAGADALKAEIEKQITDFLNK